MNKEIVSDLSIWVTTAWNWGQLGKVSSYQTSVTLTIDVNNILNAAPNDVGGSIYFGVTMNEAEELLRKWLILYNYNNSVHYEIDEYIDAPYTQKLSVVSNSIYAVDPKDFRTKKPILWFERGNSLENLLINTITDSSAKASYESLVKTLNEDKLDSSLHETIDDANFWEEEYKKANRIRNLVIENQEKYGDKWDSLSSKERLKILSNYCVEVGDIMTGRQWHNIFTDHLSSSVKWLEDDPNFDATKDYKGTYGWTYSTSKTNNNIYINSNFGIGDPPQFNLAKALNTVTHETRHKYQGAAYNYPEKYNWDIPLNSKWFDTKLYPDYPTRPWEVDARAYAGLIQTSE